MKKHVQLIHQIQEGSIAWELELEPGDIVLSVNDQEIEDVFDYHFLINDEEIELLVKKKNGELLIYEIEKEVDEDLGIVFESSLMDDYRSCSNKCIFCFIDQLPPGMRETLYFKDDDSRLSFLQGNYITLTNMKDADIERIIKYKLEPINISVHTTNPELRCSMLGNRFAGRIMEQIKTLYEGGITMNAQIVLCKGVNDGEELERSIEDLSGFMPLIASMSVVPVGITKYRDGLYPLESFTKEDAIELVDSVERWQEILYEKQGSHFVHASDEWYLLAGRDIPAAETYDSYPQLENGVGMLRLLLDEFHEALALCEGDDRSRDISLVSGVLACPHISMMAEELRQKFPNVNIRVYEIVNEFFGENITVSGLLTGGDIIRQLQGKELGERLLLPVNLLRSGEEVLLDDMSITDIEKALQIRVWIVKSNGQDFIDSIIQ